MEFFIIFGVVVGMPVIVYSLKTPKESIPQPPEPVASSEPYEEVSLIKFNAKLRQEKILENMSSDEKKLFLSDIGYEAGHTLEKDEDFLKYTNYCMTVLLLISIFLLLSYISQTQLSGLISKNDL
jgi:hypothetical protein